MQVWGELQCCDFYSVGTGTASPWDDLVWFEVWCGTCRVRGDGKSKRVTGLVQTLALLG